MKIKLPVTWQVCGTVEVEADSIEDAIESFQMDHDYIKLPDDGDYVDGSFELSTDDEECVKEMQ
jgi:hypothetical protein